MPTDQVDRVQKYIGSQDSPPVVTRLNSGDWQRATKKAKKQVQEMAADLVKLYAARKAATGHALPPDTPWQTEMEDAFPYEETPDQMAAIEDVKKDLEDDKPMDRLICGDVGYGKTEVAIRAAFKVVNSGRQVAVLCPTTILAQQHLGTFRERLAAYPVKIEMLSRFVSKAEATQTLKGLAEGTVDIVIGTHKILVQGRQVPQAGPAGRGRRTAVRRRPQRAHQADEEERGRADADGDAHPPDAAHVAVRHPGHVPD